jgi:hypothetical protein
MAIWPIANIQVRSSPAVPPPGWTVCGRYGNAHKEGTMEKKAQTAQGPVTERCGGYRMGPTGP